MHKTDVNETGHQHRTPRLKKGVSMKSLIKKTFATITALSVVTMAIALSGCGSSGSSAPAAGAVSGTAAVGAPLVGQVSLKDSSATPLVKTTSTNSDGSFSIDVTGLQAPFILEATGNAAGTNYKLHSFAEGTGTANINPLSDAIVASAAGDEDASQSYDHSDSEKLHKIGSNLQNTVNALLAKLQPLLQRYNAQNTNPITGKYIANHLDLDEMFDFVKITVSNGMLSIINNKTGATIFTGSLTDIANGVFTNGNMPPAATAPAAPTGLTATGGAGQVSLSWSAVTGATSYNVYYSATTGVTTANGTKIAAATNSYVQTGLTAATTYYYIVTAVNSAGESTASAQASATTSSSSPTPVPTAPAAPTAVTATGGANQVSLSWPAVTGATSYNVYYSTTSGVTTANGTKVSATTNSYVQTGLAAGTAYYYIVTAVNSAGESTASAQATATTSASAPAFDALSFYNTVCLGCHGTLGVRTAAQITSAIASISSMSQFRSTGSNPLTAAQITAIAAVSH